MMALVAIGFLIYGPVMLIGLYALELAPKKAAGTAAGFTGLFGYLGGAVAANAMLGYTVDHFGWDGGFVCSPSPACSPSSCWPYDLKHENRSIARQGGCP